MLTPRDIVRQVNDRILRLVEAGLADHQFLPAFQRAGSNVVKVVYENAGQVSISLKSRPYGEIYRLLVRERAYNVKMIDGALIQVMYEFSGTTLLKHRLAFFPAPHLREFQNDPDVYIEDEIHGDVLARDVVPFPLRFDYDAGDDRHREVAHPRSHLTLGQYEHCRIPVTAPVTPYTFIDFILRNFYRTASRNYADEIPIDDDVFGESIAPAERRVVHMSIPTSTGKVSTR